MYQFQEEYRFPNRKYPRLKEYDYSRKNFYFITICTDQKKCIFGSPTEINTFGKIVEEALINTEKHFPDIRINKYVIMPNHVHIIFEVTKDGSDLINAIGAFKSAATKKIHKIQPDMVVWQRSFHDHVIRHQKSYEEIWVYIDGNPLKWEEDCFYQGK
jgi:REP element-mobilizing transposase RayT